MKVEQISFYNSINAGSKSVMFGSASDITLEYALKKHSKFLPKTMIARSQDLLQKGLGREPFWKAHVEVFKDLFDAKSLDDVKSLYSEFADVQDIKILEGNRSKAIQAILKIKPFQDFTLFYLKKLYSPMAQDKLVEELGFTNRSLLAW